MGFGRRLPFSGGAVVYPARLIGLDAQLYVGSYEETIEIGASVKFQVAVRAYGVRRPGEGVPVKS